jgi:hypothetical protein
MRGACLWAGQAGAPAWEETRRAASAAADGRQECCSSTNNDSELELRDDTLASPSEAQRDGAVLAYSS